MLRRHTLGPTQFDIGPRLLYTELCNTETVSAVFYLGEVFTLVPTKYNKPIDGNIILRKKCTIDNVCYDINITVNISDDKTQLYRGIKREKKLTKISKTSAMILFGKYAENVIPFSIKYITKTNPTNKFEYTDKIQLFSKNNDFQYELSWLRSNKYLLCDLTKPNTPPVMASITVEGIISWLLADVGGTVNSSKMIWNHNDRVVPIAELGMNDLYNVSRYMCDQSIVSNNKYSQSIVNCVNKTLINKIESDEMNRYIGNFTGCVYDEYNR